MQINARNQEQRERSRRFPNWPETPEDQCYIVDENCCLFSTDTKTCHVAYKNDYEIPDMTSILNRNFISCVEVKALPKTKSGIAFSLEIMKRESSDESIFLETTS